MIQLENIDPFYLAYRELKSRSMSEKTIATYLFNIKKFLYRVDKNPEEITEQDLAEYLEKDLSNKSGAYPQLILSSLNFFFNEILKVRLKSPEEEPIRMSVLLSHEDYAN